MPSVVGICLLRICGGRISLCKDFIVDDKEDGPTVDGWFEFVVWLWMAGLNLRSGLRWLV